DGSVLIFWSDSRDGNQQIYYKFSADGGQTWGADTRLIAGGAGSREPTASVEGNEVHVVWSDGRNGYWAIYYKDFTGPLIIPVDINTAFTTVNTNLGPVTFTTSAGSISGLTNIPAFSLPCSASGFVFPFGMFSYNIAGLPAGGTSIVTISVPTPVPMGAKVFKCQNGNLVDFTQYVQQPDPNTFILTLKDGGQGDSDGQANGTIVDPCGMAFIDSGPHQSSAPQVPTVAQGPAPIANIAVQSASLSNAKVAPGAAVTVTANVANKGTANGSSQIKLYVNGQEEAHQGVTLSSGGRTPVKFTVSRDEPGTYSVYVGSTPAGSFTVDTFADSNLILYISGALILFSLVGGLIFIATRIPR
ncbi:MAG: choice-of-anchor U domain-containing protein, partial [Dehalococcoidia bacterium]